MKPVFDEARLIAKRNTLAALKQTALHDSSYLHRMMCERMKERLKDVNCVPSSILQYGSGHCRLEFDKSTTTHADTSKSMLEMHKKPSKILLPSMQDLSLIENDSYDAAVSILSMHWLNDPSSVLKQLHSKVRTNSPIIGCFFAQDTLKELRSSLQLANAERKGGYTPHMSPMIRRAEWGSLLKSLGFQAITVDCEEIVVEYPSLIHLLNDLEAMGERNVKNEGGIGKDVLMSASSIYHKLYGRDNGVIPATFEILNFIAWT